MKRRDQIKMLPTWQDLFSTVEAAISINGSEVSWEEMEKIILKPFGSGDVAVKHAVARWTSDIADVRGDEKAGEVVHSFENRGVLESVVRFCRADILENYLLYMAKLAKHHRMLARQSMPVVLAEKEGIFVDEENGEQIVPELLSVRRVSAADKIKTFKQVVRSTLALAEAKGEPTDGGPEWPIGVMKGLGKYVNDIQEFIQATGEGGCEFISRVCTDVDFAASVRQDEKTPQCVKFLAEIVTELSKRSPIPSKKAKVGFQAQEQQA